ncbi:MAG: peroxide stress protein YaaA [Saprospiraceae bacterium]|nr:peroxide stress protein YaaA [Saprospiraceae bacterium]
MIILLSPAKTLDFSETVFEEYSTPRFLKESKRLVNTLKKKSAGDIQQLMSVSEKIANLNVERYKKFTLPFTPDNAKPSILAFKGDVYIGLEAEKFDQDDLEFAQEHIRILSGLYGVLKPLDLMQPYRLEMGTSLETGKNKNLYEFWGNKLTKTLNEDLQEATGEVFLNLASNEYFKAVQTKKLKGRLLDIDFKENRDGELKFISYNEKKARGRMAHLVVKERIENPETLKELVVDDYVYSPEHSDENNWMFVKETD